MNKRIWLLSLSLAVFASDAFSQARQPNQAANPNSQAPLKSAKGNIDFSRANPEDITDENFPNLIESFDYPNANIAEVVKAISKLTGKNFILEKGVSGTISIIAPSRITVAEAYRAFLTALAMNGYTIVPSGNFLKIRQIATAAQEAIDTYSGSYFPNTDQLITRIVRLKYISAEEVEKTLRPLVNKQAGDIRPYAPTNSLIITDFGSNIERITTILNQLDVPGFEEKLVVITIKFARAKDISDLIDQIINKGDRKSGNQFNPGIPRFRTSTSSSSGGSGAANYSLVLPDGRTNSIIVVGNDAGIERIRGLVAKLDFRLRPEDSGGVYVYYVRHGESEKIANVLNGIATESAKTKTSTGGSSAAPPSINAQTGTVNPVAGSQAVFGGDVKVAADKENNSLIITAAKTDYEVVRSILAKIDIPRDQVFVKAVIMETNASDTVNWGIDYYKFAEGTNGIGRAGFRGTTGLDKLTNPANDQGMVLGFGTGKTVEITVGTTKVNVPSLLALVNFFKSYGGGNILSTPQVTALDNEEAEIVVGQNVPISQSVSTTTVGTQASIERKDLNLKFTLTPYISPDTDSVRLKIDQKIDSLSNTTITGDLGKAAIAYDTRSVKTNVIVNSNDTAVIGGLMSDEQTDQITKIPVLGDIPILGWLFKSKISQKKKKNLMIFITPRIIRNSQDGSDLLNAKLNERIDFIQQNLKGQDPHGYEVDKLPRKALSESETEEYIEQKKTDTSPVQPPAESLDPDDSEDAPPEGAPSNQEAPTDTTQGKFGKNKRGVAKSHANSALKGKYVRR